MFYQVQHNFHNLLRYNKNIYVLRVPLNIEEKDLTFVPVSHCDIVFVLVNWLGMSHIYKLDIFFTLLQYFVICFNDTQICVNIQEMKMNCIYKKLNNNIPYIQHYNS